jgi:hypothetical protein
VPKVVEFRTQLPYNIIGKVLRRLVRDEYTSRVAANEPEVAAEPKSAGEFGSDAGAGADTEFEAGSGSASGFES